MGEDTTGRTLTEELCFMLFFGLNRGKRHFLMTGGLPSGTPICNIEAHDWWTHEGITQIPYISSIKHVERGRACGQTQVLASHRSVRPQRHLTLRCTHHLRFFLLLLYRSEEALLLLLLGRLRGVQHHGIWASPGNKTKQSERPRPGRRCTTSSNATWRIQTGQSQS